MTARRVHVVPAKEALMQITAPNLYAHHAILVHIVIYKVLHQRRIAKSALEGGILHHQASTNVSNVPQAVFATLRGNLFTIFAKRALIPSIVVV